MDQPKFDLGDVLSVIKNDQSIEIGSIGEQMTARLEQLDELSSRLNSSHELANLVFLQHRPGGRLYATVLEHTYFKPYTPEAESFHFRFIRWKDLLWTMITIPIEKVHYFSSIADEVGMKVVDGRPFVIDHNGQSLFPISCLSLENDHEVFSTEDMESREDEAIRQFYRDNNVPGDWS